MMADTEFDGELPMTPQQLRDVLAKVWPSEMGLVNRITFEFSMSGPVVEVDYLGDTMDDIRVDVAKGAAITEVRRYRLLPGD